VAIDLKKEEERNIIQREYLLVSCFIIASHNYMFSIQEKITKKPSKEQGIVKQAPRGFGSFGFSDFQGD
jgi:hypothetical protein